tara:strand:- start:2163 stop:2873 length:711 start_codon:yes stop_codon:yes gene_type:complete
MKFAILGSCVTRDIFSELGCDQFVGEYRARTSLHTFFEQPIGEDKMPDLQIITSSFQRRMVEADFRKKDIELSDCDYLIVDFIDDRFNIVEFENSKVTLSSELSKVIDQIGDTELAFKRGSEEDFSHWKESCKKFSKHFSGAKTILHSSRFATHQLLDGNLSENDEQSRIEKMNFLLEKYEQIFIEEVNPVWILKVSQQNIVSNVEHKWGVAPFHYILPYYQEALDKLKEFYANCQ